MSNPPSIRTNFPLSVWRDIPNDGEEKKPENDMWNMYLSEVKEDDQRISNAWKEDANGILVFTGLFSATVGAFIIEFYKNLSANTGSQTVTLLEQISQQLAGFPNGDHSYTPLPTYTPSAPMVLVNAMWLISFVLSITSALIATLLQQWARRYVDTPKVPSEPNHRARVRWFLFSGTDTYRMRPLIELTSTLLHLSVYLFFAGLVITFHTINTNVAIAVDVSVGVFGLAYVMLSILPCLDVRRPYCTPMSYILWFPCHIFLSLAARGLRWLLMRLHGFFVEPSLDGIISSPWQVKLVNWLNSCEEVMKNHLRYFMDGFGKSVIKDAIKATEADRKIITSLFNMLSLNDKRKLRKLAAGIPRHRFVDLTRQVEYGRIGFRDPLLVLLSSCEADEHATGADEDERRLALAVCLDAIHHISKSPDIPELNFVRANFANTGLMRKSWDDSDPAIRVKSRSICALIARKVGRRFWLEEAELRWLQDVTGEISHEIRDANVEARDRMNVKSFIYGVLSNQVGDLPTEDATSFKETLAILLDVRTDPQFDSPSSENRLSEAVRRIREDDPEGSREVVNKLYSMFPFIPDPSLPPIFPFPPPHL